MCLAPEDYAFFAYKLLEYAKLLKIRILSWSLIPNHYHIMCVQTGKETPGKLIERTLKSFVKFYNKKYSRCGPLFESRYKSKEIGDQSYFNTVVAYILTNAVHHKLVKNPEEWLFCNYKKFKEGKPPHPEYLTKSLCNKTLFLYFIKHYLKKMKKKPPRQQYLAPVFLKE